MKTLRNWVIAEILSPAMLDQEQAMVPRAAVGVSDLAPLACVENQA